MTDKEMIESLWPHPVEDADGDKQVTLKEKLFYALKMIPWTILSIFVPLVVANVKKGVTDLLPTAMSLAADLAVSKLTGEEKATSFNQSLKEAAIAEGISLATSDINWLRENAVAAIKGEETAEIK